MKLQKLFMFKTISVLLSAIFVFTAAAENAVHAQTAVEPLPSNKKIARAMKNGEIHRYKISLKKDETIILTVYERAADVVLALQNAEGKNVGEMNTDQGFGREFITYISETDGDFTVVVSAKKILADGRYELENIVRQSVEDDKKRITAEAAVNDFFAAYAKGDGQALVAGIPKMEQAGVLFGEVGDLKSQASVFTSLGVIYSLLSQKEKSGEFQNQAMELFKSVGDERGQAMVFINLATVYSRSGDKKKALEMFEQGLPLIEKTGSKDFEMIALQNLGTMFNEFGETKKSFEYLQKALRTAEYLEDKVIEGKILINISNSYMNLGDKKSAIEYGERGISVSREAGDKTGEVYALNNLANLFTVTGEPKKSVAMLETALTISKTLADKRTEVIILRNLGQAYTMLGESEKALELLNQVLSFAKAGKDKVIEGRTLSEIGLIYINLGDYHKSAEYYEQVLNLSREIDDKNGILLSLGGLGRSYTELGQLEKAIEIHKQQLKLAKELGDRRSEMSALSNLGRIYGDAGKSADAVENLEQSLLIARGNGDKFGEAYALANLGVLYFRAGDKAKGLESEQKALILFRESANLQGESIALSKLMFMADQMGNSGLAVFYGKRTINNFQQLRRNIKGLEKETQQIFLSSVAEDYQNLAEILIKAGRLPEAQQVLALLKEEEYFEFVRRDAKEAESLSKNLALTETERKALEEYKKLADNLTEIGTRFQSLQEKRSKSGGKLEISEETEYENLKKQIETANEGLRAFLKTLSDEFSKKVEDNAVVTPQSIETMRADLRRAGNDTVLISTYLLPDRYRVIVTTGRTMVDRKVEYADLKIDGAEVNRKILQFKQALQNPTIDPRPLGKELYDIFVKPIEKDLQGAKAKTLLWSLDGALRYIPTAALYDGEKYLAERYQNVIITLARQSRLFDAPQKNFGRIIGAGVSKKYDDFSELPAVPEELRSIVRDEEQNSADEKGVLRGVRLLDEKFSLEKFRNTLPLENDADEPFTVVHLATHFRLGANNRDSYMLLGDGGRWSLYDLGADEEVDFNKVELLTLSACETGVSTGEGNGREVESFAMLAQQKGAKAVMATLWKVADESTGKLMTEFYRVKNENSKMSKIEALREAQMKLLYGNYKPSEAIKKRSGLFIKDENQKMPDFKKDANAPFAHPYFWSPFILIGNWQ